MNAFMLRYWNGRAHDLGKMSLGQLARTFFTYPAIVSYLLLSVISFGVLAVTFRAIVPVLAAAAAGWLLWPLVWYVLHRFVLHGRFLFKIPFTARLWKRIHFDHHQDPFDLRVLFGAVHTTLPPIALASIPAGYLIGAVPGAAAAFCVALLTTCLNEFVHCVQHLNVDFKWGLLRRLRQLHLAHHFHSEKGNFGIADMMWDHVLGTFYASAADIPRSPTVYNLGYTAEAAAKYPAVLLASLGQRFDDGPRRFARTNPVAPKADNDAGHANDSGNANDRGGDSGRAA